MELLRRDHRLLDRGKPRPPPLKLLRSLVATHKMSPSIGDLRQLRKLALDFHHVHYCNLGGWPWREKQWFLLIFYFVKIYKNLMELESQEHSKFSRFNRDNRFT